MPNPVKTTLAMTAGALALGLLGAVPALADDDRLPAPPPRAASATPDPKTPAAQQPVAKKPAAKQPVAKTPAPKVNSVYGQVISQAELRIRHQPNTRSTVLGALLPKQKIKLACKRYGENVAGNDTWYRLSGQAGWVAARHVKAGGSLKGC
ncbi:SH3 domain-containing protein [Streptomyces sp. NPDC000410]|uniref:SH3 domain-containing protein n=1 Tax=Streptomyces sp. NPDC000410 TaxID=3154254 RepID=UPI0033284CAB